MSSSHKYFDDDILDPAIIKHLDNIEAIHLRSFPTLPGCPERPPPEREVIAIGDLDAFGGFNINEESLNIIDRMCGKGNTATPVARPSRATSGLHGTTSVATLRATPFASVVQNNPPPFLRQPVQRAYGNSNNPLTSKPNKTKKWDYTALIKSGRTKPKTAKGKEKESSFDDGREEDDWEEEELEQFPAPLRFVPSVSSLLQHPNAQLPPVLCVLPTVSSS